MIAKVPLRFKPYLKSVIWGGDRICRYKNIESGIPNIGESWEISVMPDRESVVDGGIYSGLKLTELIDKFGRSLLGDSVYERYGGEFPLLVKFIDANQNLSVQVHPDDHLAKERHGGRGKSEMWYVIEAEKGAKIYAGFQMELTPEELDRRVAEKRIMETLAWHNASPGDVFYLPAGRVHAIGAGIFLAEIQVSSDITYRIYDYDRKDKEGNTRPLHAELARDAITYKVYPEYKNTPVSPNDTHAELVKSEHFTIHRVLLDGDAELSFDKSSFTVLMGIEGCATVFYPDGETELKAGQTLLLPAALTSIRLKGKATILTARS